MQGAKVSNLLIIMTSTKPSESVHEFISIWVRVIILAFVILAASPGRNASAQVKPKDPQGSYDPKSAPGAGQKYLEQFAGDWSVEKIFHPRDGDPVTTKGECHQAMINGGRFLKSDFNFYDGATNTTGVGLIGFVPDSGIFTSVWIDSRSTKMSIRQSREPFDGSQIVMYSVPLVNGVREARPSRNTTHLAEGGRKIIHQQYVS